MLSKSSSEKESMRKKLENYKTYSPGDFWDNLLQRKSFNYFIVYDIVSEGMPEEYAIKTNRFRNMLKELLDDNGAYCQESLYFLSTVADDLGDLMVKIDRLIARFRIAEEYELHKNSSVLLILPQKEDFLICEFNDNYTPIAH